MKNLNITVANKVAAYCQRDGFIVCGNSDYQIAFTFDSEWDAHLEKTARFKWNEGYKDVEFSGTTVQVPRIEKATYVEVGVYVQDLSTTTPAIIPCTKSILCETAKEYISEKEAADMEERIGTLENDREILFAVQQKADATEQRLNALEDELDGIVKLYKHDIYINSGSVGTYNDEAKITLSFISTDSTPITTLAELATSPAAVQSNYSKYLNYMACTYHLFDAADGNRDVQYIIVNEDQLRIYYAAEYTVPMQTAITTHKNGNYQSVIITDTVTQI